MHALRIYEFLARDDGHVEQKLQNKYSSALHKTSNIK